MIQTREKGKKMETITISATQGTFSDVPNFSHVLVAGKRPAKAIVISKPEQSHFVVVLFAAGGISLVTNRAAIVEVGPRATSEETLTAMAAHVA